MKAFVSFSGENKAWVRNFTDEEHFFYGWPRDDIYLYIDKPVDGGDLREELDGEICESDAFIAVICSRFGRRPDSNEIDPEHACVRELETAIRKWDGPDRKRRGFRIVITEGAGRQFWHEFRTWPGQPAWLLGFAVTGGFMENDRAIDIGVRPRFVDRSVRRIKAFCQEIKEEIRARPVAFPPDPAVASAQVRILLHPKRTEFDRTLGPDAADLRRHLTGRRIAAADWTGGWALPTASPARTGDASAIFVQETDVLDAEDYAKEPEKTETEIWNALAKAPGAAPSAEPLRVMFWLPPQVRERSRDLPASAFEGRAVETIEATRWPRFSLAPADELSSLLRREFPELHRSSYIARERITNAEEIDRINGPVTGLSDGLMSTTFVGFDMDKIEAKEGLQEILETRDVALVACHDLNLNPDNDNLAEAFAVKLSPIGEMIRRAAKRRQPAPPPPVRVVLITQRRFLENELVRRGFLILPDIDDDCEIIRVARTGAGVRADPEDVAHVRARLEHWKASRDRMAVPVPAE